MTSLANSDVQVALLNHKAQIVAYICLSLLVQHQHVFVSLLLSIEPQLAIDINCDALRYTIKKLRRAPEYICEKLLKLCCLDLILQVDIFAIHQD